MRIAAWITALLAIGDGVVTLAMPRRHVRRWSLGPDWYQRVMRPFAERPGLTPVLGAVEAAAALWWTTRLPDRES